MPSSLVRTLPRRNYFGRRTGFIARPECCALDGDGRQQQRGLTPIFQQERRVGTRSLQITHQRCHSVVGRHRYDNKAVPGLGRTSLVVVVMENQTLTPVEVESASAPRRRWADCTGASSTLVTRTVATGTRNSAATTAANLSLSNVAAVMPRPLTAITTCSTTPQGHTMAQQLAVAFALGTRKHTRSRNPCIRSPSRGAALLHSSKQIHALVATQKVHLYLYSSGQRRRGGDGRRRPRCRLRGGGGSGRHGRGRCECSGRSGGVCGRW